VEAIQTRDCCVANDATPRGSPRSFAAQNRLAQDDNRISTRDCCVANGATLRADHPDPSLRKIGLLRMTNDFKARLLRR
jgi:hypothetical protein